MDFIISELSGETIGKVELISFDESSFKYTFKLIENNFPADLLFNIKEYDEILSCGALSLLEEVEEEIHKYKLRLQKLNVRMYHIFLHENTLIFYSKYPSVKGFMDVSPFGW